jgi:hypothetical protein
MHWVLQNNLFNEEANRELLSVLERHEIPHSLVKVIPFGGGIEPELSFPVDEKIVVIGSVSLVKHAQNNGWTPGAWLNDNFSYENYNKHYGSEMLNFDSVITTFKEVPNIFASNQAGLFVRPNADGKEFAGTVFSEEDFLEWFDKIAQGDSMWSITMDTEVLVSKPKYIFSEYRCISVRGKIVTASQYKQGKRVLYSHIVPQPIIEYAQEMVDNWQPADVFVIDIAEAEKEFGISSELKVVEINNFNSAGWYNCNVSKIVQEIEAL